MANVTNKKFKKKWVYNALLWKTMSAVTGALIVLYLTGEYHTSWQYLALYVPITLLLFVMHEFAWQLHKIHKRCPKCGGTGVLYYSTGDPYICLSCQGTGDRAVDSKA